MPEHFKAEDTIPPRSAELSPLRDTPPGVALLIYHRDNAEVVQLVPRARLVIGRAPEADLSIPEPTLSRQHARIEMVGNDVWIEDLDSSNGTRVNGRARRRARLRSGDDVMLGTVRLSIHTTTTFSQGLEHHAQFTATLDEELVRARTFGHQLALLMVREAGPALLSEWCSQIRQVLRPVDRIALHSPGTVEILLPETGLDAARQQARAILDVGGALRCSIAEYPGSARSGNELLSAAERRLDDATEMAPIVVAPKAAPRAPRASPSSDPDAGPLICGEAMRPVYETVERIAPSPLPVLIYGETGSGKEVVARALHQAGPRRQRPMRCINCGAIPRDLVQSILFGHERGSFTGATQQQKGVFEEADGSSLLLDEVGELPPEAQVALLRVLETGRAMRLGSSREIPVNVRIISATHRNLVAMCEAGTFRWDLYYRLHTVTLEIPPLRQRRDELEPLANHFLARACEVSGIPKRTLAPEALRLMLRYQWPGNVRELRNAMERAALVAGGEQIQPGDLPERVRAAAELSSSVQTRSDNLAIAAGSELPSAEAAANTDLRSEVRDYEISLIRRALQQTGWNKTAAAQHLQIPLRTFMHKVQQYGLSRADPLVDDTAPLLALDDAEHIPDFKTRVRRFESELIARALDAADGNKAEAARRLNLPLSTMLYKMKVYELDGPEPPRDREPRPSH